MRKEFDEYFDRMAQLKKRDLSGKERGDMLRSLQSQLVDWGTSLFPQKSFQLWLHFDRYGAYPYPGTFLEQPTYIQDDFTHWTMLERFWEINNELPTTDGIPTLEELISR